MKASKRRFFIEARNRRQAKRAQEFAAALAHGGKDEDHPLYPEYEDWRTDFFSPDASEDPRTMHLDVRASFQQWLHARSTTP